MINIEHIDQSSIKGLKLTKRTFHALHRNGVFTVGKLKQLFLNKKLDGILNIGQKSIDEISIALIDFYNDVNKPVQKNYPASYTTILLNESEVHATEIDRAPIDILHLNPSIRGALIKNEIMTIGDLRNCTEDMLLNINLIGPKVLAEIRKEFKTVVGEPIKYVPSNTVPEEKNILSCWAEIVQSYFEGEKDNYIYILLSRFGLKPKKLEEIASELNITRERVRQVQEAATVRFLKYVRRASSVLLLEKIHEILLEHGENLSLKKFKGLLRKENLLGEFSQTLMSDRISKIDLFETLICWLNLLSDSRHTQPPVNFPVDIKALINSDSITIKDSKKLQNISPRLRKKIKRKVHFTGGINIKEASKILSEDERTTELVLQNLNLQRIEDNWYSLKKYDAESDTSKIPLRIAGLKMLAVKPDIHVDIFYDGLRRYINRFYPSIAPINIIVYVMKLLGFEINNQQIISKKLNNRNILSRSEKSLVSAITKNGGVASFLEIAEEFFLQNLSLPAVSVTLKRSPIAEKVDEGFYKLRGTEISWQQIDTAKKRQKRYSQDEEIFHGLDGIVRVRITINNYAYLTGVVGSHSIKEMMGSWSVIYNNDSFGDAKMDETYLWGLPKIFKKLDLQMGDRIELAFNTWNRTLSVEKVNHGNT